MRRHPAKIALIGGHQPQTRTFVSSLIHNTQARGNKIARLDDARCGTRHDASLKRSTSMGCVFRRSALTPRWNRVVDEVGDVAKTLVKLLTN